MRTRSVYDSKGKAYEITDGIVTWQREDYMFSPEANPSGQIINDIEPFVSPIDGSIIKSRRGYRDHCKRHNVVPTAELKGLPPLTFHTERERSPQEREVRKRIIGEIMSHKRYFEGR